MQAGPAPDQASNISLAVSTQKETDGEVRSLLI